MDPKELRTKWLENLRSGKYEQGRSALKQYNKYCCLGVLCETAIQLGIPIAVDQDHSLTRYEGCSMSLPEKLQEMIQISDNNLDTLMYMNDNECRPFEEIANYIEAAKLGLPKQDHTPIESLIRAGR